MNTREMVKARTPVERVAYRVEEFMAAFGIGRTTLYNEINAGRLAVVKVGACTLIGVDEAERWWAARCASSAPRKATAPAAGEGREAANV